MSQAHSPSAPIGGTETADVDEQCRSDMIALSESCNIISYKPEFAQVNFRLHDLELGWGRGTWAVIPMAGA
jgi:hypothetical protein